MPQIPKTHSDKNVFLYASMGSYKQALSADEAWLISQLGMLVQLANSKDSGFAEDLLKLLRNSPLFEGTERVCLAQVYPNSSVLEIIDSANSHGVVVKDNKLQKGYSCFVSSESSLLKLEPGQVRIYSDINSIFSSFIKQEKPIQRSVRLIGQLGFKSGLAIPLHHKDSLCGVLFLNSSDVGYFNKIDSQRSLILSSLYLLAMSIISLRTNSHQAEDKLLNSELKMVSQNSKNWNELTNVLSHLCSIHVKKEIKIQLASGESAIYPLRQIANCLYLILNYGPEIDESVELFPKKLNSSKMTVIEIKGLRFNSENLIATKYFEVICQAHGYQFFWSAKNIATIKAPFDVLTEKKKEVLYST